MARRATIKDIAREAGVSMSTVDRALNGRVTVREETMRKIAEAAHRIGYHARGLFDQRLDLSVPEVRLGFVLLKEKQEFYRNFRREIEAATAARCDVRATAVIRFAQSQSPHEIAQLLRDVGGRVDALAAIAVNHRMLDQVVQDLQDAGVPTFSLLNDFAQGIRRNYIGLNNMKVGRQAAWTITRTCSTLGKVAIFVGGNRWHGHDLREVGFRAFMRENAPAFTVLDTLVNLETRQLTYEATLDLLTRHPDLSGIYVAGGGMEGAIAALREVRAPEEVALVVNEVTTESRAGLLDGYVRMVVSTPLRELCTEVVQLMLQAQDEPSDRTIGQHFLAPRLILPEIA